MDSSLNIISVKGFLVLPGSMLEFNNLDHIITALNLQFWQLSYMNMRSETCKTILLVKFISILFLVCSFFMNLLIFTVMCTINSTVQAALSKIKLH